MKLDVELINGVAEFGSGFNALWHGTIMETDAALWRGLPVPTISPLETAQNIVGESLGYAYLA
jgi:hypothetical protein